MDQHLGRGASENVQDEIIGTWIISEETGETHEVGTPRDLAAIAAWPGEDKIVERWGVTGLAQFFDAVAKREAAQKEISQQSPIQVTLIDNEVGLSQMQ